MNPWRWFQTLFYGGSRGEIVSVFDLGTSVAKTAIAALDYREGTVEILGLGQAKYSEPLVITESLPDAMLAPVISQSLAEARRSTRAKIRRAYLVGQPPFIGGATFTFSYVREGPKAKVDNTELKNIIQKIQWRALEKIRKEMRSATIIYARITEVRIDGYRVASPVGFQGKEVTLTIFNIYASPSVLGALAQHLAAFKLELAGVTTQALSLWTWLSETRSENFGAIVIDVGGAGTRVSVFRRGRLEGERVFSIGAATFARRLTDAFSVTAAIAEDILGKYEVGRLSNAVTEKIAGLLKSDVELWKQGLMLVVGEFAKVDVLPQEIFLIGAARGLSGLAEAVQSLRDDPSVALAGELTVALPDVADMKGLLDPKHLLTHTYFVAAIAGLEFVKRTHDRQDVLAKILRRATRLLQPT